MQLTFQKLVIYYFIHKGYCTQVLTCDRYINISKVFDKYLVLLIISHTSFYAIR